MSLTVKQESTYKSKDWWAWAIWLDGTERELDSISYVVYTLHPTFPNPVVQADNRQENFRLESAGWGEFEIYIDIHYKNGKTRRRKHLLKLEYPQPLKRKDGYRRSYAKSDKIQTHEKKPTLFLSTSMADIDIARNLRAILSQHGITVLTEEQLAAGTPLVRKINAMISAADIAVFVISGRPSLWMNSEIEWALTQKVSIIIPLLVGSEAELPVALQKYHAFRVKDKLEVEGLAQQIIEKSLQP